MSQINILFQAKVKDGQEAEFYKTASELMKSTRAEDDGCITFTFHQHSENPRLFFCYEQWRDQGAMNGHFERLAKVYGAPREGEILPSTLSDFFEEMKADIYNVVE
jgi:quinol monooxygenase YgiN